MSFRDYILFEEKSLLDESPSWRPREKAHLRTLVGIDEIIVARRQGGDAAAAALRAKRRWHGDMGAATSARALGAGRRPETEGERAYWRGFSSAAHLADINIGLALKEASRRREAQF